MPDQLAIIKQGAKGGSFEMSAKPFNADGITIKNWDPIFRVKKRPVIVHATQLNFPEGFEVTTPSGKVKGEPGDYLMIGPGGEKYPCKREIFDNTYDIEDKR